MNEFVVVVKTNSFVHFLGEFEDTKSPFEIISPLVNKIYEKYFIIKTFLFSLIVTASLSETGSRSLC